LASDFKSGKCAKDFLVQISHEALNSEYEKAVHHTLELTRPLRLAYPGNYLFVEYVALAVKKLPPEKKDEGLE
jgi:hypothetical protein